MGNKSGWIRWLPGLLTLRQYQVSWLAHDVVAGTVLATMLVPVGIAYAVASGLPGICVPTTFAIALQDRAALYRHCDRLVQLWLWLLQHRQVCV